MFGRDALAKPPTTPGATMSCGILLRDAVSGPPTPAVRQPLSPRLFVRIGLRHHHDGISAARPMGPEVRNRRLEPRSHAPEARVVCRAAPWRRARARVVPVPDAPH